MKQTVANKLIEFLDASPSCYHAVANLSKLISGFEELKENEIWKLEKGKSYYVVRKDSSIIAFRVPVDDYECVHIVASHSDSPTFKLKPNPEYQVDDRYVVLNTEKYGGMIMYSWLDRPLSVAGRVIIKVKDTFQSVLVNLNQNRLIIPSVAIHMNRKVNSGMEWNAQIDMLPLAGCGVDCGNLRSEVSKAANVKPEEILGEDLFLYTREKACIWGANKEFISSRALDDLECAFLSYKAFADATASKTALTLCCVFDNEEVGSLSGQGADSTFLTDVLTRINESLGYKKEVLQRAIANGFMISADNAHAVHPNHKEYADPTNKPYINEGIVIKYNGNQKYTTDGYSDAIFRDLCQKTGVKVQTFANRSNMEGGSTLGNLSNRHISIKTVDIGLPQLAMHSSYETAGVKDTMDFYNVLKTFYES